MKTRVQARALQKGDRVGSGETVDRVFAGAYTPRGKIEVVLRKHDYTRTAVWGAYTEISVTREEA